MDIEIAVIRTGEVRPGNMQGSSCEQGIDTVRTRLFLSRTGFLLNYGKCSSWEHFFSLEKRHVLTTNRDKQEIFNAIHQQGGVEMAYIDKHFKLTEEVCSMIRNRDQKRFPRERDMVEEAVLSYGRHSDLEEILEEMKKLCREMEKAIASVGWK